MMLRIVGLALVAAWAAAWAGRTLRRTRTEWRYLRSVVVVELGARESELREHRSSWRRGPHLLLRDEVK
jgi:hypothetical protein